MSLRPGNSYDFDVALAAARGRTVVRVRGEVDVATGPRLRRALADGQARRFRDGGSMTVVVDLSGVTFMDASGLGVLISAVREARRLHSDLVIRNPSPATLRLLEVSRLMGLFEIEWDGDGRSPAPMGRVPFASCATGPLDAA
jgi:anti-sigma B factor antagonist